MSFVIAANGQTVPTPCLNFTLGQVAWLYRAALRKTSDISCQPGVKGVAQHYGVDVNPSLSLNQICIQLEPCLSNALLARADTMKMKDVEEHEKTLTEMKRVAEFGIVSTAAADITMLSAAALRPELFSDDDPALKRLANDIRTLIRLFNTKPEERADPNFYLNGGTLDVLRSLCTTFKTNYLTAIPDSETLWRHYSEAQRLLHARLTHVLTNQRDNGIRKAQFGITFELLEKAYKAGIVDEVFFLGAAALFNNKTYGD